MLALIAEVRDGHAGLWAPDVRPPVGKCQLPVNVRFVEGLAVISGFSPADSSNHTEMKIGDVITELDAVPVGKLVESWKPYYSASNDVARLRDIGRSMTRGECGESNIGVRREGQELKLRVQRIPPAGTSSRIGTHDLPGPGLPATLERRRLSQAIVGEDRRRRSLRRTSCRHQRTHHRHSQLPLGICGLCAWVSASQRRNPVCTLYGWRSDQRGRLSLDEAVDAESAAAALPGENRDPGR